jgi:hypothetical protein
MRSPLKRGGLIRKENSEKKSVTLFSEEQIYNYDSITAKHARLSKLTSSLR